MGYKIKPKYPLFLRDINKNKDNSGEDNISNGYPIVIIEDYLDIKAKPNTFHAINNGGGEEININFVDEEFYPNTVTNEFIFNVRSPANISFNKDIMWNNNEEPDFAQEGMFTISILAGVGCYTFVNI